MSDAVSILDEVAAALEPYGLVPRGGLVFDEVDQAPPPGEGMIAKSVVLVGHYGSSIWPHFMEWRQWHPNMIDPLDAWSKQALSEIAADFGAKSVFPSDRPYLPFQQWAGRAEGLRTSPLGMLIHPEYGLWHAYRGALLFDHPVAFPTHHAPACHPCDTCAEKPCLSTCPAGAFNSASFAVDSCRHHLAGPQGATCMDGGCLARLACPVGRGHAYAQDQQRFHMAAFAGI
ncbi:4Fe-4S dicluster domain-containing protein [Phyllobacterium endophyticum]|uniref:Ferredoxin n=1 Tax=Phyllobacterium endophyticum TaxID=1149773 RepID=A0A2P7AN71_9HYPH|nr:4Fe-4S dicluster domain-containing protein [Phyllobacterium endophyticum]MBB3234067.1 ferredoxin-like protein FixX [Phyllobacterium endophyticum]PSH55656.1 hypothetical protein CU100_18320 [Phyllobacterium endophyticum]TYR43834.1 4Fe-4S dicluster domain-containing protein [Phyllobacterium endophyticum]